MNDYIVLFLGILCAGIGGELFLRGLVGIARWARISAGIIGATVAAFATSSPELSVGIGAALSGKPQISLGDTLGSNVVNGATGIAMAFGIDAFIIGATVVAIGTSIPELATTVIAQIRGYHEVGLGNILGSNIFNGLLIVSVVAMICPIAVVWREVLVTLAFGIVTVALTWPPRHGFIHRKRGVLLVALYAGYIATTILVR